MTELPTGEALHKRAKVLGVITDSDESAVMPGQGNVPFLASDHEIQKRVIEAEKHIREHRLWIVALISAIASVISAAAAWYAVYGK